MTKTVEARTTLPAPPKGYGEPQWGFPPGGSVWLDMFGEWRSVENDETVLRVVYALPLPKPDPRLARAIEQIAEAMREVLAAIESARFSKFKLLERAVIHEDRRRALARMFAHQDDKPSAARTRYVLLKRKQNIHE